jgi:ABC-type uncharacterized transport system fused permease/ATPase subunit
VAELKANVKRLIELNDQIDSASNKAVCSIDLAQKELLKVEDLIVYNEDIPLFQKVSFDLCFNDSILIRGCVGSGKSTLLQVLKGKTKMLDGSIKYRKQPKILFLSHKPYS